MRTDVLVIGAGPAGSSAAYFLAKKGVSVLLADRSEFPREKACGEAIGPTGVRILTRMGAMEHVKETGVGYRFFDGAYVFAPNGDRIRVLYPFRRIEGEPPRGCMIRRYELDEVLKDRAVTAGAKFLPGFEATEPIWLSDRIAGFEGRQGGRSLAVDADLVLVATGAQLGVVRALGVRVSSPVSVMALRGYFRLRESLCTDSYLELHLDRDLLPFYGWIFPVSNEIVNVGVVLGNEGQWRANGGARNALRKFVKESPGVWEKMVGSELVESPKGFPLRTDFLSRRACVPGALLVGEAAGLVDPLVGEGIAFSLQSGEMAARAAYDALLAIDVSAKRLAAYDRALRRRYSTYFRSVLRLRSRLRNPKLANSLLSFTGQILCARANGWAFRDLASALWMWTRSWRSLGLAPFAVYRAFSSRSRRIEEC